MYALIIHTRAIYGIQITASLSDEDAVYLIEGVVGGLHICKRVLSPTVFMGLPCLFVGAVDHPG